MVEMTSADLDPVPVSEPLHYTGYLFRRAQQVHVAAWQRHVSATVSSVQFGVLTVIDASPGASQNDLCDELDLDRSTIADLVSRLERNGMIERERDDADRRRNRLRLSEQGRQTLDELRPRAERVEQVLTDSLEPDERRALRALLVKVLRTHRPNGEPGAPPER